MYGFLHFGYLYSVDVNTWLGEQFRDNCQPNIKEEAVKANISSKGRWTTKEGGRKELKKQLFQALQNAISLGLFLCLPRSGREF